MALLNGIYIHVTDEQISSDIELTSHPVEQGADITDHVNIRGYTLSLSGKIVEANEMSGANILGKIHAWKNSKTLLRYDGRNICNNLIITKFTTAHPNTVWGGCEFDMELKELRIAKNSYVASEQTQSSAVTNTSINVGDIVVFKGGGVYVSSDALNRTATRGRSTCKVTLISRKNWSIHQIHLISTDGGKVYGWVNEDDIESFTGDTTETKLQTDAGTQIINNDFPGAYEPDELEEITKTRIEIRKDAMEIVRQNEEAKNNTWQPLSNEAWYEKNNLPDLNNMDNFLP